MSPVLRKRIISGVILAAGGVGMLYLPGWAVGFIVTLIVIPAQLEFYKFLHQAGIPSFRAIGLTLGAFLTVGAWLTFLLGGHRVAWEFEALALSLAVGLLCTRQLPRKDDPQPLITLSCTLLGIMYVPFLFNFFLKLAYSWEVPALNEPLGDTGRRIFIYFLGVVKLTDVGAYFIGSLLGRHKLMPRISPGKTVEGVIGGLAVGLVASLIWYWVWQGQFGELRLSLFDACALGLILPTAGVIGDLVESMLKRAATVKDSSRCFPGLGGILDVLDSLLFAAPVMFFYLRWFL